MEDAGGKKKSSGKKRGAGFHPQDDLQLAKSWIAVSEDPIKGTDQTKDSFWSSVKDHGRFETRTPDGLRQRWGVVSRAVSKFCGIMTNLQNKNQCGTTDEDKLDKAAVIFKQDEGKEFRFLACYASARNSVLILEIAWELLVPPLLVPPLRVPLLLVRPPQILTPKVQLVVHADVISRNSSQTTPATFMPWNCDELKHLNALRRLPK
ncbi:uncharacterized protein LOC120429972 [Culex pipiens pallens]|uniref:uncharacterized protein LOC120429972 n=1 Tax=Culex pipiens pallens TaxID=42434 RepID=UPI001953DAF8|nr:uncharacterized protein LOC120429972 [Culex pipiens pallens]